MAAEAGRPPVLDPAGPFAEPLANLSWALLAMGAAALVAVLAAVGLALFGPASWRRRLGGERAILIGGLALPAVVLTAILVWGLTTTGRLTAPPGAGEMRIRVTGEMWWWRVAYLENGREVLQSANEIHIPTGRPVTLELDSADVIHSLWIPRLGGKLDMIPGRRNLMRLQADAPGVYRGQCAEYCGGPHAFMALVVIAHPPGEFAAWRAARLAPAAPPADAFRALGRAVFDESGCGACHTVRGTPANGLMGPDLTHVGSRRTLGAGLLPNNRGVLAGWVANSQTLKPGNRMPDFDVLSGRELHALAAYLEGLK
jgi:cytochrome c oxidase subunit II